MYLLTIPRYESIFEIKNVENIKEKIRNEIPPIPAIINRRLRSGIADFLPDMQMPCLQWSNNYQYWIESGRQLAFQTPFAVPNPVYKMSYFYSWMVPKACFLPDDLYFKYCKTCIFNYFTISYINLNALRIGYLSKNELSPANKPNTAI